MVTSRTRRHVLANVSYTNTITKHINVQYLQLYNNMMLYIIIYEYARRRCTAPISSRSSTNPWAATLLLPIVHRNRCTNECRRTIRSCARLHVSLRSFPRAFCVNRRKVRPEYRSWDEKCSQKTRLTADNAVQKWSRRFFFLSYTTKQKYWISKNLTWCGARRWCSGLKSCSDNIINYLNSYDFHAAYNAYEHALRPTRLPKNVPKNPRPKKKNAEQEFRLWRRMLVTRNE